MTWTQTWMGRPARHLRVVGPRARHISSLSLGHPTCETEPQPWSFTALLQRSHQTTRERLIHLQRRWGLRPLGLPGDPPITCTNMCIFYLRQPVIGPDRKRA